MGALFTAGGIGYTQALTAPGSGATAMQPTYVGEFAALATAFCWTLSSLFFDASARRIGSLPLNLIRLGMAFVLLSGYGVLRDGRLFPFDADAHAWGWLSLSGFIGFFVGDLCLFQAFVEIGARRAMLLMALAPPMAAVMAWVGLGQALSGWDVGGMVLTLAGIVWVIRERAAGVNGAQRVTARGIMLGLGGAFGQAGGLVLSKVGIEDMDPFAATQIRALTGIVGFAALMTALSWWPRVRLAFNDRRGIAYAWGGAVFGPSLGVGLSLLAVQRTHAGVAATIMALTPVLIIPAVAVTGRERVTWRALAGAIVAVVGIGMLFLA